MHMFTLDGWNRRASRIGQWEQGTPIMCLHPSSMREHREKIHVICNDTTIIHDMSEICLAFLDGAPFKLTLRG